MTSLITVTFTGDKSLLKTDFFPEIKFDDNYIYSCALLDLIIHNNKKIKELVELGVIHINCDIISNSYINGQQSHVIHQFATINSNVKGQTLVEAPKNLYYFPIKDNCCLRSIQISITNQKGELVNIESGNIICRIILKRENANKNDYLPQK